VVGAGRVFVSAGNQIIVADSGGNVTGAITGLSQVHGLALTRDGTRLYAALHGSDEVAEIDTATLTITRRIRVDAHPCPSTLALTGDRLWIGHGCGQNHQAGVIGLELTAATPTPIVLASRLYSAPAIAAAGDTLVAGETFLSPTSLMVYDIDQATPVLRGVIDGYMWYTAGIQEIALTNDGSTAVTAAGEPTNFTRYDTNALSPTGAYGGYFTTPASVAISSDGTYIAGGRMSGTDLTLYDAVTGEELLSADNPVGNLVSGSITFSGVDVYTLLRTSTNRLHLWRLPDIALPQSLLTLTTTRQVPTGTQILIAGQLTRADGLPLGAQSLTVTRQLSGQPPKPLDGVTTAANGTFTITDQPPGIGKVIYTVAWAGDSTARPDTAEAVVLLTPLLPP
jgi:YVTN family beta-propeller protein